MRRGASETSNEIIPGAWHWTAPNPSIGGKQVSSYWLEASGVAIDPLLPPDDGIAWFASRRVPPSAVVLSNRHHYRDSGAITDRFGCAVQVPALGLHAFEDDQPVVAYEPGDSLPGGLIAVHVGVLSPDDGGLYHEVSGSLWLADTIVRSATDPDARIGWVLDALMDDPPGDQAPAARGVRADPRRVRVREPDARARTPADRQRAGGARAVRPRGRANRSRRVLDPADRPVSRS